MAEIENKPLDRYSYSKISCYGQCKFKFKLKYLDKNFLFSANIATDFGSLVHSIEEDIAKALQAEQPINYIALKNKFIIESRKLALKYPTEFFSTDKSGRTYQEKVYLYLDSAIYRLERYMKQHPELRIIGIEQKFEYDYDGVHSFNGSIDRAFINIETNEVIGKHNGLMNYTIGQRRGLDIGGNSDRLFVVGKNIKENILFAALGDDNEYLYSDSCIVKNLNFFSLIIKINEKEGLSWITIILNQFVKF